MSPGARRDCLGRLLGAGLAAASAGSGGVALAASGIDPARPAKPTLPALRRGINLSHWFEYEQGQDVPAAELLALHRIGFDHVRIPVDPLVGGWRPDVGGPRLAFMPALRAAIEAAIGAGLDVVIDLHLEPSGKQRIERAAALEPALAALWSWIGRALSDLPPARLAFELYNEPQYYGREARRWPRLQLQLLDALRQHAPRHLVLVSGNEGGSLQGLRALPPIADGALAHVFHYYEPFLFTHQGAHWLDTRYTTAGLRSGVPYPATAPIGPVAPEPGLSRPHFRAAAELAAYRATGGHAARVRADIDAAGTLARAQGLRLVCTEFGALRAGVDPASRNRWIADVRTALEANGLGWALWDYCDIFGIAATATATSTVVAVAAGQAGGAPARGARVIDPAALQALGLGPRR